MAKHTLGTLVQHLVETNSHSARIAAQTIAHEKLTWSGSGASKAFTVSGAKVGDSVFASIETAPTQDAYLVSAKVTAADTVTVVLSAANTSNDAVIRALVARDMNE